MSRASKRYLAWAALGLLTGALALAAAGCGGGGSSSKSSEGTTTVGPTSIGKGEGALNLIEWPYYSDPKFANTFEKNTGCKIHRKDAGSSNQMVSLMRTGGGGGGGQWDLVSASGDASLRLIRGGDVKPVNIKLIPSWNDFIPIFKSPAHNTVDGKHYGVSLQWGPNVLLYNTTKIKPGPTNWGALYDPKYKGQITIPNNPIQIADAALYLSKTKPALGIKDPYELNSAQLHAAVLLLKGQRPLIKAYWAFATDEAKIFQTGGATLGAAWPLAVAQLTRSGMKVSQTIPKEGATGWSDVWMLAKHPKNLPCAQAWLKYASGAKVQAEVAKFNTYTPANLQSCKALGATLCKQLHADGDTAYLNRIKFWKTPLSDCGNGKNECAPYSEWVQAWTSIKG